jgi:hypothetical protein
VELWREYSKAGIDAADNGWLVADFYIDDDDNYDDDNHDNYDNATAEGRLQGDRAEACREIRPGVVSRGARNRHDVDALRDPWKNATFTGFKTSISGPEQGNDVYRHIYGHGGAVVAGNPASFIGSAVHLGIDLWQLSKGKTGVKDEVRGSLIGLGVGAIMTGGGSSAQRVSWISRIMCQ